MWQESTLQKSWVKEYVQWKRSGILGWRLGLNDIWLNKAFLTDVPQLLGYGQGTQQNSKNLMCPLHLPSPAVLWSTDNHYLLPVVGDTWKLRPWWQKVYKHVNWSQPQGIHSVRHVGRCKKNGREKVEKRQWWPAKTQQVTNPGISSSCVNYTSLVSCQGPVLRRKFGEGQEAWPLQGYPLVWGNSEMSSFPSIKFRLGRISDF